MGWISRHLAIIATALCLAMLPGAAPRAQTASELLHPYTAIQDEMTSLRDEAAALYIESYYCPPPKPPSKRDHEAMVDAMAARAQALKGRYDTMKAQMQQQALNPIFGPQYAAAGVDPNDRRYFMASDRLMESVFTELRRRQAELDKAPIKPCKDEAPPEPPKKQVRTGPLTSAEEALLEDLPLSVPTFDDPVALPAPPRFCSFAERNAWMKEVFWPTAERAKQNALKAIETHARAEERLRAVIANDREDSPRIDLARRSVEAWRVEKDRRMAEHRKILDTDIPNPVDCTKPAGETIGVLPPVKENPDGTLTFNRPQLIWPLSIPPLPPCFVSEEARQAYMREVYFPLLDKVNENGQRRADYMWKLSEALRDILAKHGSASAQYKAAEAEYNAYDAERKRAQAFHDQVSRDFHGRIQALPICSLDKPTETGVIPGGGTPPPAGDGKPRLVAPSLNRPQFERVPDIAVPKKFCTAQDRNDWMKEAYDPAVAAALKNARTAQDHLARLNAMFTEHMRANSEHWAAVRAERDAFEPIAAEAAARAERLRQLYDEIMAVPIIPCGQDAGGPKLVVPGVGPGQPATTPRLPCPPTQTGDAGPCPRQGRDPINVGPNGKVGSGAQLKSKLGGMAMGALAGALGGGGGGGGDGGPDLWTCKIKDSEMTVFNDPASGVALKVGAKRDKKGLVIFSKVEKSPDKGTFQTAFLERPETAEVMAPRNVGPCDLWGEWKLTVSWTRDTYVDGSLVKHEEGGWSEGGLFSVPGVLSKGAAPDGLWKRMGFSNASNGAREMATIFDAPRDGGPLTFVIHVTRPKGDPVTTVPFVLTMTEAPGGKFVFTKAEKKDCPDETGSGAESGDELRPSTGTQERPAPSAPEPESAKPAEPSTPKPVTGGFPTGSPPVSSNLPRHDGAAYMNVSSVAKAEALVDITKGRSAKAAKALDDARCKGPDDWNAWRMKRVEELRGDMKVFQDVRPKGPDAARIGAIIDDELVRMSEEVLAIEAMTPPVEATTCPDSPFESILDAIPEDLRVPS